MSVRVLLLLLLSQIRCCSVLQCDVVCCGVLQRVTAWCSVLQCVAVCCSVAAAVTYVECMRVAVAVPFPNQVL